MKNYKEDFWDEFLYPPADAEMTLGDSFDLLLCLFVIIGIPAAFIYAVIYFFGNTAS